MIIVETPSLILRQMTLEDIDSLAEIHADPVVMQILGGIRSYEVTRKQVEKIISSYEKQGFGLWATIHKKDNKFIGRCGLLAQVVDGVSETEIAYILAKEYWGKGLATEAACAIRDYGFQQLGVNRLISIIHRDNLASQRVATKTGLKAEKDTTWQDLKVRIYSISRD